jgi:hypothetical protein
MNATELGQTGLVGWREQVASRVTGPESEGTPLTDEQVRALMGAVLQSLSCDIAYSDSPAASRASVRLG